MRHGISLWQLYCRRSYIIQAKGQLALTADKMYMVIMMMAFRAIVLAKGISDRVIGSRDGMDDAFIRKGLQRTVHRHPVKPFTCFFFNIAMR